MENKNQIKQMLNKALSYASAGFSLGDNDLEGELNGLSIDQLETCKKSFLPYRKDKILEPHKRVEAAELEKELNRYIYKIEREKKAL